jgi:hypothetical protein
LRFTLLHFLLILFMFYSCKKETENQPPASTVTTYAFGGHIRGTVNGQWSNGTNFSLDFNNQYRDTADRFENNAFYLERIPTGTTDTLGLTGLRFYYFGNTPVTSPVITFYDFNIYTTDSSGVVLNFRDKGYVTDYYFNATVTSYRYDSVSRVASGQFTVHIDASESTTGHPVNIMGEFSSTAIENVAH